MFYAILYLLGIATGIVAMIITRTSEGTLQVVNTDEEGPYLFLELDEEVEQVINKEYVTLKVNNPHKTQN